MVSIKKNSASFFCSASCGIMNPILFDAVGGHLDQLFCGERCANGRTTILKKTTGWEILWYLAFYLGRAEENGGNEESEFRQWTKSEGAETFLRSASAMKKFVPVACSFCLNEPLWDTSLSIVAEGIHKVLGSLTNSTTEVVFTNSKHQSTIKNLFRIMWTGTALLQGFDDAYDTVIWTLQLENLTDDCVAPCALDIKIGRCCYSPNTSEEKKKRCDKRCTKLIKEKGFRLCGMHCYLSSPVELCTHPSYEVTVDEGGTGTCCFPFKERVLKSIFYSFETEEELICSLDHFFSSEVPLGKVRDGVFYMDKEIKQIEKNFLLAERLQKILGQVEDLVFFMSTTDDGKYLLEHMAFVSSSLFIFFDRCGCCVSSSSCCSIGAFLIDFARCGIRRLNFEEETIGFLYGLNELIHLFRKCAFWYRKNDLISSGK